MPIRKTKSGKYKWGKSYPTRKQAVKQAQAATRAQSALVFNTSVKLDKITVITGVEGVIALTMMGLLQNE